MLQHPGAPKRPLVVGERHRLIGAASALLVVWALLGRRDGGQGDVGGADLKRYAAGASAAAAEQPLRPDAADGAAAAADGDDGVDGGTAWDALDDAPFPAAPRDARWWKTLHAALAAEAASSGAAAVLLGDSIVEELRGTSGTAERPEYADVRAVFEARLRRPYAAAALGVSGDQTPHLLWRLRHGEAPWAAGPGAPKVAVVLIGTNDLGAAVVEARRGAAATGVAGAAGPTADAGALDAHLAAAAAAAVPRAAATAAQIVDALERALPRGAHVVLLAVLPRGQLGEPLPGVFGGAIDAYNKRLAALAAASAARGGGARFLDCSAPFVGRGRGAAGGAAFLVARLLPDGLHPSAAGWEALADCLEGSGLLESAAVGGGGGKDVPAL